MEVDPRIGTEIAGYRIEALLGRGGMAVVYRARDERLSRGVALKLLNPELSADERFRERFLRESKLAASLEHPNMLPVYEAGEVKGHLYIAMRYVEGTDLASLLSRKGRLESERALLIVTQLADALDAARWGRGLVHGGLNPSEVLVASAADATSREHVFLLGLGLRQELPSGATLAEAARHFGSVDYLAPEQIEGSPVSPRSDVYALGCLLFECLTGEPPFKRDSPDAVLEAHLREQPPSARQYCPGLAAGIDRVIATALAKWPEERYSTCADLAACAQAALAPGGEQPKRAFTEKRLSPVAVPPRPERALPEPDGGSVASPDSFAQRLSKRRRKSIAALGLALLLAALVAGVIWLTDSGTGDLRSATPAPPTDETPNEIAVQEGEGTAQPPADAEAPAEPAFVPDAPAPPVGAASLSVEGIRFSFSLPTSGWTPGPIERLPDGSGFRNRSLYISRDIQGSQNAEAVVFWTSFPDGNYADPCAPLLSPPVGPSAADLAAAVATAPGTELVTGPSDVTVGGRAAKHVVLTVREDLGCDPGYFYTWKDEMWGPFWAETNVGTTIRVWIVDVDGTRLFIEAETTGSAGSDLEQEIQQIVESIRFD